MKKLLFAGATGRVGWLAAFHAPMREKISLRF